MEKNFRLYNETNSIHLVLSDLVTHINTIEHQDSLQRVAKLPKSEQNILISKIIRTKIDEERREQEENSLKQQMMYQNRMNGGRGEQFGNKTSGGKWYFYNPATLSFGISEFRKKWGNRKLEDDWRRKNKKSLAGGELVVQTKDTSLAATQNTKKPDYYLNNLPKTKEDFINLMTK